MWRHYLLIIISLLLVSCSSTQEVDLTDTKLYLYPERVFLKSNQDFVFSEKQKLKAIHEAKEQRLDILYEVFLNSDETLKSIELVTKTRHANEKDVDVIKRQLLQQGFFNAYGQDGAFFYGLSVRQ